MTFKGANTKQEQQIPLTSNRMVYGGFLESFLQSSMDHFKNNLRNNYLIFTLNYFTFFLKKILLIFLIIISQLF
jgi:hypothetical protein